MTTTKTKKKATTSAKRKPTAAENLLAVAAELGKRANRAAAEATWRDQVRHIHSAYEDSEGILRVGQAMRDAGEDPALAYLSICIGTEDIAWNRLDSDAEIARICDAIRKKEAAYGLKEDEYWPQNEAPADVEKLRAAFSKRCRQIEADVLREFGEDEMAAELLADEGAFNAKYREPGQRTEFGPLPRRGIPGQAK